MVKETVQNNAFGGFARYLPVEGVTRCPGTPDGKRRCQTIHGERCKSEDGSFYPVMLKFAFVKDGVITPACGMCYMHVHIHQKQMPEHVAVELESAPGVARQQIAELQEKLARATGQALPSSTTVAHAAPPPVVPPIARQQAVRKDAPKPEAKRDERQAKGKRPQPRKGPQPLRERRPRKAGKAVTHHLEELRKASAFDEVFAERGERCAFKGCSAKHDAGLVTKPHHAETLFSVCDAGLKAARRFAAEKKDQGGPAPLLTFGTRKDHTAFVAKMRARDERDATMAKAIQERRFTASSRPQCGLIGCERPGTPAARITVDGERPSDLTATVELCADCVRAARRLHDKLRRDGQRFFFRFVSDRKREEKPRAPERPKSVAKSGPQNAPAREDWKETLQKFRKELDEKLATADTGDAPDTSEGDVSGN